MRRTRDYDKSLGKKRKMVGLTQHQVAEQSGVPLSRVVFAETGRIVLEPEELDRIRNVFRERALKAVAAVGA